MSNDQWQKIEHLNEDRLLDFIEEKNLENGTINSFLLIKIAAELKTIRMLLSEGSKNGKNKTRDG